MARVAALDRDPVDHQHLRDGDEKRRDDRREEEPRDGRPSDRDAIDDHQDARRHDGPEQRPARHDCGAEGRGILFLLHHRDQERPERRNLRERQPHDGAHEEARSDRHEGESAADVSDEGVDEIDEGFEKVSFQEKLARQDEEGDRKQGETVHSFEHALNDEKLRIPSDQEVHRGTQDHVERDGKADDQQKDETHDERQESHGKTSSFSFRITRSIGSPPGSGRDQKTRKFSKTHVSIDYR